MKFNNYLIEQSGTKWENDIVVFLRKPPRTWFEIEEMVSNRISLITRQHGDVSYDRPGKEDIKEGRRLVKALLKKFGKVAKVTLDSVDEWVMVDIIKK
jgi:hypothetical protein